MSRVRRRKAKIRVKIAFENFILCVEKKLVVGARRGEEQGEERFLGESSVAEAEDRTSSRKKYVCGGACVRVIQGTTTRRERRKSVCVRWPNPSEGNRVPDLACGRN